MAVEHKKASGTHKNAEVHKPAPQAQTQSPGLGRALPRPSSVLQRAQDDPGSLTASDADVLQRVVGLRTAKRILSGTSTAAAASPRTLPIQAKLSVGPVGDKYEREADAVAQQVLRQIDSRQIDSRQIDSGPVQTPSVAQQAPQNESGVQKKAAQPNPQPASQPTSQSTSQPTPKPAISPLQRAGAETLGNGDPMLQGGELSSDIEGAVRRAKSGGRPMDNAVRKPMEQAFRADFSGVSIHTDAKSDTLNRSIQARAFTTGQDVFFRQGEYNPGTSDGRKLLAHELTHVVQQQPIVARKYAVEHAGEQAGISDQPAGAVVQRVPVLQQAPVRVQRTYAALGEMAKKRVDQRSEEKYAQKTQEFEFKMSPIIMQDDTVNAIVDTLLARIKRIVDAWAVATGRAQGETYEREFSWRGGDQYYAAFEMTAENIKKVFEDTSQPLRTKLKLVYNAVRNNNLAKWLKLAAIELDRQAKNKTPRDWKIKTSTTWVTQRRGAKTKIVKGLTQKETVKAGFAQQSGLKDWLSTNQINSFVSTAQTEKLTTGKRSKRDVFGHDRQSDIMGWKAETVKANKERTGFASGNLNLSEQRTLTVGDVPDLTDPEIDEMYRQKGLPKPNDQERQRFRSDPNAKLGWSQGGEFYDINLGSDSAKEAATLKARLEAGISGSTDLMLHAMQNLGLSDDASMKTMRLALAGWMMANRDHSFYEIYKAAESYGVDFDIDPANPGMEYESANNLTPMQKDDFKDVLPEKKFPRYFLSTAYKDVLAGTLPEAAKDKTAIENELKAQGVSTTLLNKLDDRGLAELSRLSEVVEHANIDPGQKAELRKQALRRIRQHRTFIYLGNTLGIDDANAMLNALLKTHHGGKGLAPVENSKLDTLADAGIPRLILDTLSPKDLDRVEQVRQAVMGMRKSTKTGNYDMKPVNKALRKLSRAVGTTYRSLIKAVLIQTYHGNVALTENERLQANAIRMMASYKESGGKKLSIEQLDEMETPTPSGGTQISEEDYWAKTAARGKLSSNLGIAVNSILIKMSDPEKVRVRTAIYRDIGNNDPQFIRDFQDVERDEGFALAVTSFADEDFIKREVLTPDAYAALMGLHGLHPRELGAIFQYTTALYKPLVIVSSSFGTTDFGTGDLNDVRWESKLGTLKYAGNMLRALSSGLAKLPVYPNTVFRLESTEKTPYLTATDGERQRVAASYRKGSIETRKYPMSSSKTLKSQFSNTNYDNPKFSIVSEIINVKTGHDIQWVSDKVREEEVLFEPGARLRVIDAFPHNPNNPADKHIWVRYEEV